MYEIQNESLVCLVTLNPMPTHRKEVIARIIERIDSRKDDPIAASITWAHPRPEDDPNMAVNVHCFGASVKAIHAYVIRTIKAAIVAHKEMTAVTDSAVILPLKYYGRSVARMPNSNGFSFTPVNSHGMENSRSVPVYRYDGKQWAYEYDGAVTVCESRDKAVDEALGRLLNSI